MNDLSPTVFDGRIDSHPLHQAIYDLCQEIEKLPASEEATKAVSAASALHEPVALLRESLEAECTKSGIFYEALKRAGAPLGECQPGALYEWGEATFRHRSSADMDALKASMESARAAFLRIPDECELDPVECERRRKRMVGTKIRYELHEQNL